MDGRYLPQMSLPLWIEKKINDVNYVKESENSGTSGGSGSENGCGSLLFSGSVLTGFAVVASVYVFGRKKR